MSKVILGFVGPLSSGKGTVCQYLKEKYGAPNYRFSTILRDVLTRLYMEQSRGNMQKLSTVLRQNFSEELFSQVIARDVEKDPATLILVDGIRRDSDAVHLKVLPNFYLVAVDVAQKTRWERMTQREENTDDARKTWEQFQQDELQEAELQVRGVMEHAEFKIDNNGTVEELYEQVEEILKKI